jgi:hypothetical protein
MTNKKLPEKHIVLLDHDKETKLYEKEFVNINLRIPAKMLEEIDLYVAESGYMSRTGWILTAIHRALID